MKTPAARHAVAPCWVLAKLTGYQDAADATGAHRPVLFLLASGVRERHLHASLTPDTTGGLMGRHGGRQPLPTTRLTPAGPVWLHPGGHRGVGLIEIGAWP